MKRLVLVLLVVVSQASFAQKTKEVKRMSVTEARAAVEKSSTYKYITEMKNNGKDIMKDAVVKEKVVKVIELGLKDVVTLEAGASTKLARLVDINPLEVLSEITRLNSIVKDPTTTAQEKQAAKTSIQLIVEASRDVKSLVKNSAEAQAEKAKVEQILKVSDKIANLKVGTKGTEFIAKYKKALAEGKSVEMAIKEAFGGKHTLKELLDCV